jgi:chemotaxis protein MotA
VIDIASLLGVIGGIVLLGGSIFLSGGIAPGAFLDVPSVVMVVGGTAAAVMISLPFRAILNARKALRRVLFHRQQDLAQLAEQLVSLSAVARRDGLLGLESRIEELDHPLVADGLRMAVDGVRADVIEDVLRTEIEAVAARHRSGRSAFEQTARYLPAFGMIGTLVGLVIMLGNLRSPEAIAPGMAIAMLTTLYGLVIANLFFMPAAEKLAFLTRHELLAMELALAGILAIQAGDHPRIVRQRLHAFLPRAARPTQETESPAPVSEPADKPPVSRKVPLSRHRAA